MSDAIESGGKHKPAASSFPQMMALRRIGNNINLIWRVIVYAGVALAVLDIWVNESTFYATPRGVAALALAACYLVTYTYGTLWIAGSKPDSYWKTRINTGRVLYPWRAVTLWAALLLLCIAMIALNERFVWLIWIPFGISFTLLPMPRGLALVIPTTLLAMGYYHELPASLSPHDLLDFAGTALAFAAYSIVIYLPIVLLRHRVQRERTFEQLQQSHRQLEAAHRQLEEAAAHERELAVLRERARLARDMHDTLGHSLALIAVKLEAAQRLRPVDPARADHEVAATQTIARSALAELRAALADLRTSGNAREPLGEALTRAAHDCAGRTGWRLTCEIAPDVEPISDQAYEALLRTGLEALANAERHANARAVRLALYQEGGTVILCIEDDGVGILVTNSPQRIRAAAWGKSDADHASTDSPETGEHREEIISPQGHYGITGMRERTTGAGGTFAIGAGPSGHGTRVEARLPAAIA
ncbi:MAG TPA: sensor histidine kinase [Ktedonobacterales bacterium]|nr:sensor histidine kinase [Ktedonobacterales bacterium]